MGRRRSYAARKRRDEQASFVATNKWGLVGAALIVLIPIIMLAALLMWQFPSDATSFIAGAAVGGTIVWFAATVHFTFYLSGGGLFWTQGIQGEQFTRGELKKARDQGLIYGWVDNIELDRRDIDHLAIGPGGAIAIETKFRGGPVAEKQMSADVTQCAASAGLARSVLRSADVHRPMPVAAVLVQWGRGKNVSLLESADSGVLIATGHELLAVLDELRTSAASVERADALQALTAIEALAEQTHPQARWRSAT